MTNEGDTVLSGGNMGEVLRRGDTVVRQAGEWTPAVHRLLTHLGAAGIQGLPAMLTRPAPAQEVLRSAARLMRQIHDATTTFPGQGPWGSPARETREVTCHNDFAPYNLVFRGAEVVGVIDWDYASPGPRVWDLAYLAYRLVPLSSVDHADGFTERERETRLDVLMDAYGTRFEPTQTHPHGG